MTQKILQVFRGVKTPTRGPIKCILGINMDKNGALASDVWNLMKCFRDSVSNCHYAKATPSD